MFEGDAAVLPAYAGMFLEAHLEQQLRDRSPLVCGDVSNGTLNVQHGDQFSPRMRGCFHVLNLIMKIL